MTFTYIATLVAVALILPMPIVLLQRWADPRFHRRTAALWEKRRAARIAAGQDRYFEELREIDAWKPEPWQPKPLLSEWLSWSAIIIVATLGARLIEWLTDLAAPI